MKLKKEYPILVAVVIALVLYLVLRNTNRIHYQLPDVPQVDGKQITKLEITRSGKLILLNKKDNNWFVGPDNYPADSNKVKSMLEIVEKLILTTLVSESKNYFRYDLSGDKKIVVKAWAGNRLDREFEIGKAATTYRHTHVKLSADPNVYQAQGEFRRRFDQSIDDLRDLTVLSFDQDDIREIQITEGKTLIVVIQKDFKESAGEKTDPNTKSDQETKAEKIWETPDGKKVDMSKLKRFLSTLSRLKCEKFIPNNKKTEFKDPIYEIQLKGTKNYSLSLFAKEGKEEKIYPAISSENDYPFYLADHQVDDLKTNIKKMLEPESEK
ncbi:MAG TPA: DUF4340 domain-containing protein [Desulfobacterales bacterium]|nr:DUF4340 domain-containing protein [Desulfobacterales bacterium]